MRMVRSRSGRSLLVRYAAVANSTSGKARLVGDRDYLETAVDRLSRVALLDPRARLFQQLSQFLPHRLERLFGMWLTGEVSCLVRVSFQVVELIHAVQLQITDVFPALSALGIPS